MRLGERFIEWSNENKGDKLGQRLGEMLFERFFERLSMLCLRLGQSMVHSTFKKYRNAEYKTSLFY